MPFTSVAAAQIALVQDVISGDITVPAFSRRAFLTGATSSLLTLAPALTMVGNLLTVSAPVRNYDLTTFAGLGLSIETTVAAGNAPVVAARDVQVNNVATTGHTYTYPTSRQVGQLLIIAVATAALTTITTPGTWTLVQSQAGTESRTSIFSKVVLDVDPTTETLPFGTASGCVVRTWCVDIGDGPVEAVAGINDSAAGTSLDLATISPTWAVSEATNTLYIAVLGLADDVVVSGFPTGYTVTGQDVSASGTANIDCALAYAERSALGSSENPTAFTYAASRATAHILAIKPRVTARVNWDGLAVRKATVAVGTRRALNLVEGSNITLTMADNAGTGAVDVTIASAAGGSAHTIRDDGVDMTQRAALNFVSTATINAVLTDDAVNNETEVALSIVAGSVGNTQLANMAALTVKANPTNASAAAQDVAASADDTVFRRTSTTLNWGQLTVGMAPNDLWTYAKIQNVSATSRILGRITAGAGDIEELTGTQATTLLDNFTSALKGLAPASGGGTTNFLRADGTWAAPPGTTLAGHVIRDDGTGMTQRAALNFVSSSTINAVLTDDSVGGETEVALSIVAGSVGNPQLAQMAALTVKANPTNVLASVQDVAAGADDTVFRRTGSTLNWGQLTVGMAPNDLWTYAKIQNVSATARILGRITAAAGDIEELTGTQATTLLNNFTSALKGLAPASGGGTTNFLRADGTWAAPAGSVYLDGNAIDVDGGNSINLIGSLSEVPLNAITGAQGVVNISTLLCGGRVCVTAPTGAWSISGFTAKPEGFWFVITVASTDFPGTIINSTTADTGIRNPGFVDFTCNRQMSGVVMYGAFGGGTQWLFIPGALDPTELGIQVKKPSTVCRWWEDFEFVENDNPELSATSSVLIHCGNTTWGARGTNTSSLLHLTGIAGHPGILSMPTLGVSGNFISLHRGGAPEATRAWIVGTDILEFEVCVRLSSNSSVAFAIGFSEDPSSVLITGTGNSNIIGFYYDSADAALDAGLHCITREADGVAVNTEVSLPAAATWARYGIRQTVLGTIEFLSNGAVVATHSTQVPDAEALNFGFCLVTRTAASRTLDIDYAGFESQLLTRT